MSEERHVNANSDDEDDLELLRLAALKSLKKDTSPHKNQQIERIGENNTFIQTEFHKSPYHSGDGYHVVHQPNIRNASMPSIARQLYSIAPDLNGIRPSRTGYFPHKTYQPVPPPSVHPPGTYIPSGNQFVPMCHSQRPLSHLNTTIPNTISRPPRPNLTIQRWVPPPEQNPNRPNIIFNINKPTMPSYSAASIIKETHSNEVQLSPRSLAFVAQNNGILARRKIEADLSPKKHFRRSKSPDFRRASRSPSPLYRISPGRWSSVSPPSTLRFSKSKSRSPIRRSRSRSHHYNTKKSRSRSSSNSGNGFHSGNERRRRSFSRNSDYKQSPIFDNRFSRSPPNYSVTGKNSNFKRNKSRSPLLRRYSPVTNTSNKRHSRSRSPRKNYFETRRSRSPQTSRRRSPLNNKRMQKRPYDRKSPFRGKRRPSPVNRRISPIQSGSANRKVIRRSISPPTRKRSRTPKSPSGNKKNIRRTSKERQLNIGNTNSQLKSTNPKRKSSPAVENKYPNSENNIINRNIAYNSRRSKTPPINSNKKSKSKSPEKPTEKVELKIEQKESNRNIRETVKKTVQKSTEDQKSKILTTVEKPESDDVKKITTQRIEIIAKEIKSTTPPLLPSIQSQENIESLTPPIESDIMDDARLIEEIDAMLGENNDTISHKSDTSDDNDDGIDLFASEESESENEGRFKSSNRTERNQNIPALSFTKLKESSTLTTNVKNLQDVVTEKYEDSRHNVKGRKDYFKKYMKNKTTDIRRRDDDYKRRSRSRSLERISENKSKFRSTFQVIRDEGSSRLKSSPKLKKRSPTPERVTKKRLKDTNLANLNSENKEKKATIKEKKSNQIHLTRLPDKSNRISRRHSANRLSPCRGNGSKTEKDNNEMGKQSSSSSSELCVKKVSVYSRLGAMTNTFDDPKKLSSLYDENDQV